MPPKLSENPPQIQGRALQITNSVIFSLASIHQKMGRRAESERYADMARERGLLPKLDFSVASNLENIYCGYEMEQPPSKLHLSFEIEVYQLGGERREVIKKEIDLQRVDRDPDGH